MMYMYCCSIQCGLRFSCRDRTSRNLYYQQLKDNLLNHSQLVSEDQCFVLAAHSLQADIGSYATACKDGTGPAFDPREYFPAWVRVANSK